MEIISLGLLVILAITQALDYYTTKTILDSGGVEQNPVMAKLFSKFKKENVLVVKGILVTATGYYLGTVFIEALFAVTVLYVLIIIHNYKALPK